MIATQPVPTIGYCPTGETLKVGVYSFGYLWHPNPTELVSPTITVDLRKLLHNPFHDPAMRELTGLEPAVRSYVLDTPGAVDLLCATANATVAALRQVDSRGLMVMVAFGCAGGRHRSVVLANELRTMMAAAGIGADVTHFDVLRPIYQHNQRGEGVTW
jgi:UPF0042 nucleotide-binding protein